MFTLKHLPRELAEKKNAPLLTGILRGAERESLRVTAAGKLSHTPHPAGLGSALTHPQITTDFSEALLEFITPPCHTTEDLLNHLDILQRYAVTQMPEGECLWAHSMPCVLGSDNGIPVARYGNSNNGIMKTVYRIGLGHRYGRAMQTVAGLHYNFSLPNAFWAFLSCQDNSMLDLQAYKNERYFGLIRNFRRHYWLLIYLFGASPALCTSFVGNRAHTLEPIPGLNHTLHAPYGTSLRMGDLGYQSRAQEDLYVCYNQQHTYIETLCAAITQSHPAYEHIGLKNDQGEYLQLNTGLLQIENEFYSPIRPKRTTHPGETALAALDNRGVEYVEVRCLDTNPFTPLGLSAEQIYFLDTFLLYCALQDSPVTDADEANLIKENQKTVVNRGRDPKATLTYKAEGTRALGDWATDILAALSPVATLLDSIHKCSDYSASLEQQRQKVIQPERTPSAQILSHLKQHSMEYAHYALQTSELHFEEMLSRPLAQNLLLRMENMAHESDAEQRALEQKSELNFDEFLQRYYRQYRRCCGTFME